MGGIDFFFSKSPHECDGLFEKERNAGGLVFFNQSGFSGTRQFFKY
jgi:hypothetical protein